MDIISDYHTSKQSGKQILQESAPEEQTFVGDSRIIRSVNGNSYELWGPITSLQTGEVLEGEITIKLTEYLDKEDMLFADVQTLSYAPMDNSDDGGIKPISTAGAFKMSVSVDGEPATPYKLRFFISSSDLNENMLLFSGTRTDSSFFWTPIVNSDMGLPTVGLFPTFESELGGPGNPGYSGFVVLQEFMINEGDFFINCDYFFASGLPLTNILVRPVINTQMDIEAISMYLLFQTENAVLNGYWNSTQGGYQFVNVPVGYDVTCLGLGVSSNQEIVFGLLDFQIEEDGVYTFNMAPITEEELEDILDGL